MGASKLEERLVRLQREIERLSAQHAEQMSRQASSASPRMRQLDARRAKMLSRRVHQLGQMLKELRRHQRDHHQTGGETSRGE